MLKSTYAIFIVAVFFAVATTMTATVVAIRANDLYIDNNDNNDLMNNEGRILKAKKNKKNGYYSSGGGDGGYYETKKAKDNKKTNKKKGNYYYIIQPPPPPPAPPKKKNDKKKQKSNKKDKKKKSKSSSYYNYYYYSAGNNNNNNIFDRKKRAKKKGKSNLTPQRIRTPSPTQPPTPPPTLPPTPPPTPPPTKPPTPPPTPPPTKPPTMEPTATPSSSPTVFVPFAVGTSTVEGRALNSVDIDEFRNQILSTTDEVLLGNSAGQGRRRELLEDSAAPRSVASCLISLNVAQFLIDDQSCNTSSGGNSLTVQQLRDNEFCYIFEISITDTTGDGYCNCNGNADTVSEAIDDGTYTESVSGSVLEGAEIISQAPTTRSVVGGIIAPNNPPISSKEELRRLLLSEVVNDVIDDDDENDDTPSSSPVSSPVSSPPVSEIRTPAPTLPFDIWTPAPTLLPPANNNNNPTSLPDTGSGDEYYYPEGDGGDDDYDGDGGDYYGYGYGYGYDDVAEAAASETDVDKNNNVRNRQPRERNLIDRYPKDASWAEVFSSRGQRYPPDTAWNEFFNSRGQRYPPDASRTELRMEFYDRDHIFDLLGQRRQQQRRCDVVIGIEQYPVTSRECSRAFTSSELIGVEFCYAFEIYINSNNDDCPVNEQTRAIRTILTRTEILGPVDGVEVTEEAPTEAPSLSPVPPPTRNPTFRPTDRRPPTRFPTTDAPTEFPVAPVTEFPITNPPTNPPTDAVVELSEEPTEEASVAASGSGSPTDVANDEDSTPTEPTTPTALQPTPVPLPAAEPGTVEGFATAAVGSNFDTVEDFEEAMVAQTEEVLGVSGDRRNRKLETSGCRVECTATQYPAISSECLGQFSEMELSDLLFCYSYILTIIDVLEDGSSCDVNQGCRSCATALEDGESYSNTCGLVSSVRSPALTEPIPEPTSPPVPGPTPVPTPSPTISSTRPPTPAPTLSPTISSTRPPTPVPTSPPVPGPTPVPTPSPTISSTRPPTPSPTPPPTNSSTRPPTPEPTPSPIPLPTPSDPAPTDLGPPTTSATMDGWFTAAEDSRANVETLETDITSEANRILGIGRRGVRARDRSRNLETSGCTIDVSATEFSVYPSDTSPCRDNFSSEELSGIDYCYSYVISITGPFFGDSCNINEAKYLLDGAFRDGELSNTCRLSRTTLFPPTYRGFKFTFYIANNQEWEYTDAIDEIFEQADEDSGNDLCRMRSLSQRVPFNYDYAVGKFTIDQYREADAPYCWKTEVWYKDVNGACFVDLLMDLIPEAVEANAARLGLISDQNTMEMGPVCEIDPEDDGCPYPNDSSPTEPTTPTTPIASPTSPPVPNPTSPPVPEPTRPPTTPTGGGGGPTNPSSASRVLVPQCDPDDPNSYLSTGNPVDTNDSSFCDQYLDYCDKKLSTTSRFPPGGGYLQPDDFYNIVESLYEQCAKTCSDAVGGIENFCSMPTDLPEVVVDESYCDLIGSSEWTDEMIQFEEEVFEVINQRRNTPDGIQCYTTGRNQLWPQSSPMIQNDALKCAARIQAKNIVMTSIEMNKNRPANLHTACPLNSWDGMRCDSFSEKMTMSGYPDYMTDGFGYMKENAAWMQQTPEAVVDAWLSSDTGHCDTIMTQESKVTNTEIGVGFFVFEGVYGHIIVTAQRSH